MPLVLSISYVDLDLYRFNLEAGKAAALGHSYSGATHVPGLGRKGRNEETRPRGQRYVLGIKRDIDKEREALILTDRPTDGHILS